MATYIPGVTDVFPETPVFNMDASFYDKMLRRKQAQFDQGVLQVNSTINKIKDEDALSNPLLKAERDQYIRSAQENLKKFDGADLSLPENVQGIQNIYAPFWEDKRMLFDYDFTKSTNAEMQKVLSWRDAKDEKDRDMYGSGVPLMYLQNGLDKLRTMDPNSPEFMRLQKRRAVPFTDIQKYLNTEAKNQELEIVWTSPNGPYMVETKNGQRSQKAFQNWASSVMGEKFQDQFNVIGTVQRENTLRDFKQRNPTIPEDQLDRAYAEDVAKTMTKGYEKRKEDIDFEIAEIQTAMSKFPDQIVGDEQANKYIGLKKNLEDLLAQKEGLDVEFSGFIKKDKATLIENLITNPEGYYASHAKQRLLENWAKGRAGIESVKITKNDAAIAMEQLQNEVRQLNQKDRELDIKENEQNGESSSSGSGSSSGGKGGGSGMRYIGKGTTDVTQLGNAYDAYISEINTLNQTATNNLYDVNGLSSSLMDLGISSTKLTDFTSAMRRKSANSGYVMSAAETAAFNDVSKVLSKKTGKPVNVNNIQDALLDLNIAEIKSLSDKNDPKSLARKGQLWTSYVTTKQALDEFKALDAERQRLVQKQVVGNSQFQKLVVDRNGKKDMVTTNDIASNFSDLKVVDSDGNMKVISKTQLAEAYYNGKLKFDNSIWNQYSSFNPFNSDDRFSDNFKAFGPFVRMAGKATQVVINGESYNIFTGQDTEKKDGFFAEQWRGIKNYYEPLNPMKDMKGVEKFVKEYSKVTGRFGDSEDFTALVQKVNSQVVPQLAYYRNKTGAVGSVFQLDFNPKVLDEPASKVMQEALNPSNFTEIYEVDVNSNEVKPVDEDTRVALLNLGKQGGKALDELMSSVQYHTKGINGKVNIEPVIKPLSEVNKTVIGNSVDLNALAGKTIRIEVSPTATGTTLSTLPSSQGFYIYGKLLRGEAIKSDPILEATGHKFEITPNDNENPTAANIYLRRKVLKPNGTYEFVETREVADLSGSAAKSPDELYNFIMQLIGQQEQINAQTSQVLTKGSNTVYKKSDL